MIWFLSSSFDFPRSPLILSRLENDSRNVLRPVMENGVLSDRLADAGRAIRDSADDMFRTLSSDQIQAVIEVATECLIPNKFPQL